MHGVDRAQFKLRSDRREIDLHVGELDAEHRQGAFGLGAGVERQRAGEHALAVRSPHFLILSLLREWIAKPTSIVFDQNDWTGMRWMRALKPLKREESVASS